MSGEDSIPLIGDEARFVVLTGLSGSGKSGAIRALEDLGYFCVDNLPVALMANVADMVGQGGEHIKRVAIVVDLRDPCFLYSFPAALSKLRKRKDLGAIVIFLEASDAVLVRRFSETRRPHPFGGDQVLENVFREREKLESIKGMADKVFDTSDLTVHELRKVFTDLSNRLPGKQLVLTLVSFGYKHGVPLEADLLFDVRFLPNPYFVSGLKLLTGKDQRVQEYIERSESGAVFLAKTTELLQFLIPRYATEGKSYLTVGIGCTGGRHRSVVVAETVAEMLRGRGFDPVVAPRDVDR